MRGFTTIAAVMLAGSVPCAAQGGDAPDASERALTGELAYWLATRPEPKTDLGADAAMQTGLASYYSREIAGNRTASGERCDPEDFTAAHRTMPFGTRLRVTNLASGMSTVVRINDRGPFRGNRVIDLSHAAARAIGLDRAGTGRVSLTQLAD